MVAINFTSENAPKVASWEKCQTIRKPRKRPIKVGDRLQLYTGQRTDHCRKLVEVDPICSEVWQVQLTCPSEGVLIWQELPSGNLSKFLFFGEAAHRFALQDGFSSVGQMYAFFRRVHGLPFVGTLIKWKRPAQATPAPTFRRAIHPTPRPVDDHQSQDPTQAKDRKNRPRIISVAQSVCA